MTTTPRGPANLQLLGGSGGMGAEYADLEHTAGVLARTAFELLRLCADGHRWLVDADLLASAVVSPLGAARAESALAAAVDGPGGLGAVAASLGARAADLEAAVARYRLADRLDEELTELRRDVIAGLAPAVLLALGLAAVRVGTPAFVGGVALARRGPPAPVSAEFSEFLTGHPGIVDETVGSAAAFVSIRRLLLGPLGGAAARLFRDATGQSLLPGTFEDAVAMNALLYPGGTPLVRRVHPGTPPTRAAGLHDLVLGLGTASATASAKERQGHISLTRVRTTTPDGSSTSAWIVALPGTRDWQADPRDERPWLNDLATNLTALAGEETARTEGVALALEMAGVSPDEPVMLVGHSQGGLIAARAAEQWTAENRFRVTHVLTAGSPIGRIELPPSVQVLAMENNRDIVTHLDAAGNEDEPTRTTVLFDYESGSIGGNHAVTASYAAAAALVEHNDLDDHPSVREWIASADAFLVGPGEHLTIDGQTYDVRNGTP